jgi:hypothetical protein
MFLVSAAIVQRHGRWFQLPLYDCFLFARAHHLKNGLEVPLHWLMFFFGAGLDTLSHSRVLVGLLGYLVCTYKHTAAQEHGVPKPSTTEDPILRLSDHELDYPLIVVFRNSRL